LDREWDQLSDEQRQRVREATGPSSFTSPSGLSGDGERGGVPSFWNLVNSVESDHFKVQWGDAAVVDTEDVDWLLQHLEDARLAFLEAGYHQPLGNPTYKIPVYLGNSGGGSPSIDFSGGYATACNSFEHSYFVLSSLSVSLARDVANHELFHTVQFGSPSPYSVDDFYWEASAVWAEKLAEPTYTAYSYLLPAYTNNTSWPLSLDDEIASTDGFLHKYAMFILPMYIEEFSPEGPEALLEVWNGGGDGLASRLNAFWETAEVDTDFDQEFGHFTSHVTVMDFDHQSAYLPYAVPPRAVIEENSPHEMSTSPELYGSHYFRVDNAVEGATLTGLQLDFEGPPGWIVSLSRSGDDRVLASQVGISDGEGELTLQADDPDGLAAESWVVVSNASGESGDYALTVQLVAGGPTDPFGGQGAGCGGCGGPGQTGHPFEHGQGWMILAMLCPGFALRRRQADSHQ